MTEQIINIERMEQAVILFGSFDENIKLIQNEYMVTVICRGSELKIAGEPENVSNAAKVIAIKGDNEFSFDSISAACREFKLSKNAFKNVSACCKG